jgi:serine/threonine protein kinase
MSRARGSAYNPYASGRVSTRGGGYGGQAVRPLQQQQQQQKRHELVRGDEGSDGNGRRYYHGQNADRILRPNPNQFSDDPKGHLNLVEGDHLVCRYEVLKVLGSGSFSKVVRVLDHKTRTTKAVKILRSDDSVLALGKEELGLLEGVVSERGDVFVKFYGSFMCHAHLCLVFEELKLNLWDMLKVNGLHRGLPAEHVRQIAGQLLRGIDVLTSKGLIHCDIKPENVLLASDYPAPQVDVRLIDFGSCVKAGEVSFNYVQSRFYRAPEVILQRKYGCPVDMWSLGCVLVELLLGKPLFAGASELQQIGLFTAALGGMPKHMVPTNLVFQAKLRKHKLHEAGRSRMTSSQAYGREKTFQTWPKSHREKVPLSETVPTQDRGFLDLVGGMLCWDPQERITPAEALRHPWVTTQQEYKHDMYGGHGMSITKFMAREHKNVHLDRHLDSNTPAVPATPAVYWKQIDQRNDTLSQLVMKTTNITDEQRRDMQRKDMHINQAARPVKRLYDDRFPNKPYSAYRQNPTPDSGFVNAFGLPSPSTGIGSGREGQPSSSSSSSSQQKSRSSSSQASDNNQSRSGNVDPYHARGRQVNGYGRGW